MLIEINYNEFITLKMHSAVTYAPFVVKPKSSRTSEKHIFQLKETLEISNGCFSFYLFFSFSNNLSCQDEIALFITMKMLLRSETSTSFF